LKINKIYINFKSIKSVIYHANKKAQNPFFVDRRKIKKLSPIAMMLIEVKIYFIVVLSIIQ
jgi:hypothetical protein